MANLLKSVQGLSLAQVRDKYVALKARTANISAKTEVVTERATCVGVSLAGSAAAGLVDSDTVAEMLPDVGIEPSLALGGMAAIAGIMGIGGKNAEKVALFGAGMMGPVLYSKVKESV